MGIKIEVKIKLGANTAMDSSRRGVVCLLTLAFGLSPFGEQIPVLSIMIIYNSTWSI